MAEETRRAAARSRFRCSLGTRGAAFAAGMAG